MNVNRDAFVRMLGLALLILFAAAPHSLAKIWGEVHSLKELDSIFVVVEDLHEDAKEGGVVKIVTNQIFENQDL